MPAAIDSFDDVLSTISSNELGESAKTFSIGDGSVDMQINFTSLFSLLGLAEDGTVCRGGSAERGIAARHLQRSLSTKSRLGIDGGNNKLEGESEAENILLAAHKSSGEDPARANRKRLKEISGNAPRKNSIQRESVKIHGSVKRNQSANDSVGDSLMTIEGTPLKVDFASLDLPSELLDTPTGFAADDLDDLDSSDSDWIQPISLSVARQLASRFNTFADLTLRLSKEDSKSKENPQSKDSDLTDADCAPSPLWIACDGNDDESMVLLGSQKLAGRDVSVTKVASKVVTTIDAKADVDQLLQDLREEEDEVDDDDIDGEYRHSTHSSPIRVSAFYLQRMSVLNDEGDSQDGDESVFDFSSVGISQNSSDAKRGRVRQMVIEINCLWDSPVDKQLLQPPCVTDKQLDCQLHLTIGGSPREDSLKLGESQALIFSLYEDMKKLEAFLRGLTSGGKELTWFPMAGDGEEEEGNGGIRKQKLLSRVDELLKSEKEKSGRTTSAPTGNDNSFDATEGGASNRNLDFVAKLWDILKFCGSSMELQECLNRAVYRIVNSSSIDELPTVFSISSSNIAQRIVATQERLLRAGETSDFGDRKGNRDDNPLIGLNPLLLLAELGIDKLRQEYHSFSTVLLPQLPLEKLVSGSSIYSNPNRSSSSSSKFLDPKDRSLTTFHRLVISHYVVDSLVQIKTFFPSVNLEEAALKIAGVLRKQPPKNIGDFKTISLKISLMEDVKTEQLKSPTSWMMTTTIGGGGDGQINGQTAVRRETIHVSPFKTLPIIRSEKQGSGNFVLTRVSSLSHSLGAA